MKRQRFCFEYVSDPDANATQAAIRAGFSEKSAHVRASLMLDDPAVQAEIDRLTKAQLYKIGASAIGVLRGVKRLADSNICDFGRIDEHGNFIVDLTTATRAQMDAVEEVVTDTYTTTAGEVTTTHRRTRLKLVSKLRARELLGRKTNAFPQKFEHSGKDGGPIHFTVERIAGGKGPKAAGQQQVG